MVWWWWGGVNAWELQAQSRFYGTQSKKATHQSGLVMNVDCQLNEKRVQCT